jgi:hypothetical protein
MYNETHKTATMKVDEPKTPYSHMQYDQDEEGKSFNVISNSNTSTIYNLTYIIMLNFLDPDGPLVPRSRDEEEESKSDGMNWNDLESAVNKAADQRSRWDRDSSCSSSSDKEDKSESEGINYKMIYDLIGYRGRKEI